MARIPRKAVGPMYIGRVIPEHVKDPRAPVDKSRVLIPGVSGQIPELLRIAVKRTLPVKRRSTKVLWGLVQSKYNPPSGAPATKLTTNMTSYKP